MRNFKLFLFVLLGFSAQVANACYSGCVVDKCSGWPLANYPYTVCAPLPNGITNCQTYYTDANGCYSAGGGVGSTLSIGGNHASYNGGPCIQMDTVSAFAMTGTLGSNSATGFNPFWQGSPYSVSVANHQITNCGPSEFNENYVGFSYMASNDILAKYCIKIEVYQIGIFTETLVQTIGWIPFMESRKRLYNPAINIHNFMNEMSRGKYRLKVSIKCCDGPTPTPITGVNTFSGTFQWNPPIVAGDAEFQWIGSSITEAVNNDGINNNLHPNDGTIWQLGAASVGVAWVNSLTGSAAVTKIQYTLIKDEDCTSTNLTAIKNEIINPSSGQQVNNINFNAWTTNYFAFGGPSINIGSGNIPNPFPIQYTYNDCFHFTVKVWGNHNCPPKEFSGTFKIYSGNAAARVANGSANDEMNVTYLSGDDGILELRSITELTKNIYPNPTSGVIYLENFKIEPSLVRLFDSQGRIQAVQMDNNQIDISHLTSGIYFLHTPDVKLGNRVDKVIKI